MGRTMELELFRCERRALSLTKASCAASWQAAERKRPEPWEGRWHCRTCPIGAAHAGKPQPATAATVESLQCLCPRCQRQAPRLINGRLCVSCYNREREALRGRNAKGGVPRLTAILHDDTVLTVRDGILRLHVVRRVTNAAESMMVLGRAATGSGSLAFSRPAAPLVRHPRVAAAAAVQLELGL